MLPSSLTGCTSPNISSGLMERCWCRERATSGVLAHFGLFSLLGALDVNSSSLVLKISNSHLS
jgi:hypothetical protein